MAMHRKIKQPLRLFDRLPSLYPYRSPHSRFADHQLKLGHKENAAELLLFVTHPDLIAIIVLPQVTMRIDHNL